MQHQIMDIAGVWRLVERPLTDGVEAADRVIGAGEQGIDCVVPGDISDSLVRAGRMPEPLVGVNFRKFDWIDERSWWLTRNVDVPGEWAALPGVELSLDGLDYGADIWLNGQHLGQHHSAFYPFIRDVKAFLRFGGSGGSNTLLVRLTTGRDLAEPFKDDVLCRPVPTQADRGYSDRGMPQRIFLRKPAYTWGWDWGPYLATCGITGNTALKPVHLVQITDVSAATQLHGPDATVRICAEIQHQTYFTTCRADVTVTLTDEDGAAFSATRRAIPLASGLNHVDLTVTIPDARLWWPNGSGGQHRYQLQTTIAVDGQPVNTHHMSYGLRTVGLIDEPGRFAVVVNGQPLFIKGGNWIPSDSLYGRLTDEKLVALVREAAGANFNCLRIWGGGRYEADAFYEACEQQGILLWHDFMSACAPLPADRQWFSRAFEHEAVYQIRRLRSRCCMMLWCGNNEVSQFYQAPWFAEKLQGGRDPGWALYHQLLPALIHQLCPHLPYRPTSPYGGASTVNDHHEGDRHHWMVMRQESEFWSNPWYWDTDDVPIFNSEYGYGGPCCMRSTKQYLGTETPDLFDETGRQHTNAFYDIPRVNFSIRTHYKNPVDLPLEQYILLGGLCQGLNLGYSLESMRANPQTMGGIFWMYNDTWGENGWTIIDYYLRRKISYYNVKRCLAHRHLLLRRGGQVYGGKPDEILLLAINDTPEELRVRCEWGYLSHDGSRRELVRLEAAVEPFDHAVIATMQLPADEQLARGAMVVIPSSPAGLVPASWLRCPWRQMQLPEASVRITDVTAVGDTLHVTVQSDGFAHAVHLNVPDDCRLSDHYFDLFAGMSRTVVIENGGEIQPRMLRASCVSFA